MTERERVRMGLEACIENTVGATPLEIWMAKALLLLLSDNQEEAR